MADKRITQIATTYDRDDLALATDYLIVDRSGGSSARILAEEVVHGVLENTDDPIVIASDVNVDSGTLFVDVSKNRVGVGTTSPVADFEIRSASTATLVLNGGGVVGGAGVRSDLSGTNGSTLALWTKADGGASTERVRITNSGNVGVGTTTPSVKLQVAGAIAITDGMTAPSTVSGYAVLYVDSSDGDLKVKFGDGTVKTIVTDS